MLSGPGAGSRAGGRPPVQRRVLRESPALELWEWWAGFESELGSATGLEAIRWSIATAGSAAQASRRMTARCS
ncbi:hypothetical protein ACH5WX_04525, partial [Nocardioides sp. CER28]